MKFEDTLLRAVLRIPVNEYKENCTYMFVLKLPFLISLMIIAIPTALCVDFIHSFRLSTKL